MSGGLKGFIALAKQRTLELFLHSFLHREAFISKSVVAEDQKVLDETIKMVNYTKSRPLRRQIEKSLPSYN
jgi:hypothetical protein